MLSSRTKSVARTATVAAFIGLTALGTAGLANASVTTQDTKFLAAMEGEGITFDTPAKGVNLAQYVCSEFGNGRTFAAIAKEGQRESSLTDYQLGYFIGGSVYTYCPEYSALLPQ